ncbi:MAG: tRNA uridine(34) 5-carboxymethylaminomethyl modification radical SAM/GNAT enzyme Elp3, partial [Myxococcales bacterium]|nr:tRNA uridine(34) 5-carboxymethylaminomethyl modification radical SAM/GNAT enzyme Elp3 [Myxococcales bacterium]
MTKSGKVPGIYTSVRQLKHDPNQTFYSLSNGLQSAAADVGVSPEETRVVEQFIEALCEHQTVTDKELLRLFRRFPRAPGKLFRKSELIRAIRILGPKRGWEVDQLVKRLRMKPVRSQSGVLPVTVLTKPFPCPGQCVFCPNDVRMPKSYLSNEPGALRAAMFRFDPYAQVTGRLYALAHNGHVVDKVELIILGGTWTHYPESYRLGFVQKCFEAMNHFAFDIDLSKLRLPNVDYTELPESVCGLDEKTYNSYIHEFWRKHSEGPQTPHSTWRELDATFRENQDAQCRNVGMSIETRPDEISVSVVQELRRMGVTKVQIGIQSMSDEVLKKNKRGHTVRTSQRAVELLRSAGFKIQAHWMANLVGATVDSDKGDYVRLFSDSSIRPDELKLYPTSLIESAELMQFYQRKEWRPYSDGELLEVVQFGLQNTPRTCRLSRVIRDIPGTDIVVGNKEPNFRERAERSLRDRSIPLIDIRAREIGAEALSGSEVSIEVTTYDSRVGDDFFIEALMGDDRLAGFCRLFFPNGEHVLVFDELQGAAIVRELHVYGRAISLSEVSGQGGAQHEGLGRRLLEEAEKICHTRGFSTLAVISAIGTRRYYEKRGFHEKGSYHVKQLIAPNE